MSNSLVVSNRQLAKIERATNFLYQVQQEIASTEQYAVKKVAESLHEVAHEVKAAQKSGQLTTEKLAAVDALTERYMVTISYIANQSHSSHANTISVIRTQKHHS